MVYLILSIFSSSIILLLFKHLDIKGIDVFQTIVFNYLIAGILGLIISYAGSNDHASFQISGLPYALFIGLLFIVVFFLIARSTRHAGVSTTTVATKMSVVIPVLFSILRYNETLDWIKITGICIALLALFLTVHKKSGHKVTIQSWLYPIIIFFGTGIVDTFIKYSQAEHIPVNSVGLFNAIVFGTSFLLGSLIFIFSWKAQIKKFEIRVLFYGALLGFANFGSLFFLISALNNSGLDSSVVFPLNNIGVVVLSVLSAIVLFKEKLSTINFAGVIIAIFAVLLLVG